MAEEKKKSQVEDINRSIYDVKDKVEYSYKADKGLTEDVIREISREKDEPDPEARSAKCARSRARDDRQHAG